jgi:hypothetical protein
MTTNEVSILIQTQSFNQTLTMCLAKTTTVLYREIYVYNGSSLSSRHQAIRTTLREMLIMTCTARLPCSVVHCYYYYYYYFYYYYYYYYIIIIFITYHWCVGVNGFNVATAQVDMATCQLYWRSKTSGALPCIYFRHERARE